MECVAQIEHYSALCTSPPVKTAAQYIEYTNEILSHIATQEGYDINNKQASNALYARRVQKEMALAAATSAANIFQEEYANRKQAIWTKENGFKDAVMKAIGNKMDTAPNKRWDPRISKSVRHLHTYAMQVLMCSAQN